MLVLHLILSDVKMPCYVWVGLADSISAPPDHSTIHSSPVRTKGLEFPPCCFIFCKASICHQPPPLSSYGAGGLPVREFECLASPMLSCTLVVDAVFPSGIQGYL